MRIPHVVQLMLKYVVPIYLIIILGASCATNLLDRVKQVQESRVAFASVAFICAVSVAMFILIHVAGIRWRSRGMYDEGEAGEGI